MQGKEVAVMRNSSFWPLSAAVVLGGEEEGDSKEENNLQLLPSVVAAGSDVLPPLIRKVCLLKIRPCCYAHVTLNKMLHRLLLKGLAGFESLYQFVSPWVTTSPFPFLSFVVIFHNRKSHTLAVVLTYS